ncbi:MAG: molybdopterin synthase sulfur carrier subunit [Verrucomicrobiota bacterium]|jgi:molybdopterin converting factor small subunit
MKVRVQFFSQLRDLAETAELYVDLAGEATVADLLTKLYELKPKLREHDSSILVGAGLEFVGRDYVLKPGEEISIMPPVQGG